MSGRKPHVGEDIRRLASYTGDDPGGYAKGPVWRELEERDLNRHRTDEIADFMRAIEKRFFAEERKTDPTAWDSDGRWESAHRTTITAEDWIRMCYGRGRGLKKGNDTTRLSARARVPQMREKFAFYHEKHPNFYKTALFEMVGKDLNLSGKTIARYLLKGLLPDVRQKRRPKG